MEGKMINKNDISIAISVLNHKMSILSQKFKKDDGGWISEKAYVHWNALKNARDLLRR